MGLKYRVCERTYDDKSNSACTQDGGNGMDHLDKLEAQSIYILREAYREF